MRSVSSKERVVRVLDKMRPGDSLIDGSGSAVRCFDCIDEADIVQHQRRIRFSE